MADDKNKLSRDDREAVDERIRLRPPVVYEL